MEKSIIGICLVFASSFLVKFAVAETANPQATNKPKVTSSQSLPCAQGQTSEQCNEDRNDLREKMVKLNEEIADCFANKPCESAKITGAQVRTQKLDSRRSLEQAEFGSISKRKKKPSISNIDPNFVMRTNENYFLCEKVYLGICLMDITTAIDYCKKQGKRLPTEEDWDNHIKSLKQGSEKGLLTRVLAFGGTLAVSPVYIYDDYTKPKNAWISLSYDGSKGKTEYVRLLGHQYLGVRCAAEV